MDLDILEFRVPVESNKTLFVWDIPPSHTEDQIYEVLFSVFSSFGPLYLLKVFPNAPPSPPGSYCLVKFFSSSHASSAQRSTYGKKLLQSSPLKVRLSSRQTPHFLSDGRPLSHARCLDLANHCLGFNGWTSDIITLKELTNEEEEGEDEEEGGGSRRRLKFGCLVQLCFPRHNVSHRGAAVLEDSFTCSGPEVLLQRRCRMQRTVRERALQNAFSAVLLILTGEGKVMVEVSQTSDQILPEQLEGLLQVNEFSWGEFAAEEEEGEDEEWNLT